MPSLISNILPELLLATVACLLFLLGCTRRIDLRRTIPFIALLALAQLRRPGEFQTAPSLHDWKDSGVFEQKAAVTLQLWKEADAYGGYDEVTLYNLKNRMGKKYPPQTFRLNEETVTFERI